MDALGSGLVNAANEVAVDILRHERNHRSGKLRDSDKCCVKGHICVSLIAAHSLRPEALAAAADIPVAHLVDEVLQRTRRLGDAVIRKVVVNGRDKRIESREQPSVHGGQLLRLAKLMLRSVELVYIGIEHEESVDVPERTHKLALTLDNRLAVEAVGQPRGGVRVEIPANRVRAVGVERVERVNGVALGLRHLLTVLILNVSEDKNILIGSSVEQQGRYGEQRIEPSSRLIDGLGDELSRELLLEQVVISNG